MTAALFLGFVVATVAGVGVVVARYRGRRAAAGVLAGLVAWCLVVGLLGSLGVARDTTRRPPGMAYVIGPVAVFLVAFAVAVGSPAGAAAAAAFPLWLVLGLQGFRVGVELFLNRLRVEGVVPRMLTFDGANVDVYVGLSAPLVAWASTWRGRRGVGLTLLWNGLGLLALANVVARSILTAPGPLNLIHAEVPNRMMGTFPFLLIPGLFVPLAVVLHVLAVRTALGRMASGARVPVPCQSPGG